MRLMRPILSTLLVFLLTLLVADLALRLLLRGLAGDSPAADLLWLRVAAAAALATLNAMLWIWWTSGGRH